MDAAKNIYKPIDREDLEKLSKPTSRTFRVVLRGRPSDLPVYEIPVKFLYFNIENGRYADRMIKLRADNPGVHIDPRQPRWRDEIKDMLLGISKHVIPGSGDRPAAERLKDDIEKRTQLVPGLVGRDGGVLDGNRRLAVLMELAREHFDGVILPEDTSIEDKWRLEAGLQLGKPIVHDYSPVNELLKVREGLEIFKRLKRDGRDPAPNKSPEELVAEAIYGRDVKEIKEWLSRIELMDQYLEFLDKRGRYYLIGDRSERFLEAVKLVEAAKQQGWPPSDLKNLKAWLFHQIQERNIDNWELREIYKIIGGDPTRKGKKPIQKTKARENFVKKLPDSDKLRVICKNKVVLEDNEMTQIKKTIKADHKKEGEKSDTIRESSLSLKDEVLEVAQKEKEEETPIKKLEEAHDRLDSVRSSTPLIRKSGKTEKALNLLGKIGNLTENCKELLKK
jgi:hypothetical protein